MVSSQHKIVDRAELADHLKGSQGQIVCTNGVFDLMHIGHLRYLEAARALGDLLVVGVNSDASTRRLKGAGRPIVPQAERAAMLAGLACVDIVTIFDEDSAEELVRLVRPALYVKGGDYALAGVPSLSGTTVATGGAKPLPEAAIVLAQGGQVTLIPYIEGHSTTELINRIVAGSGRT